MRKFPILCALFLLFSCSGTDRYIQVSGQAQGGAYTVKLNMKEVAVPAETVRDSIDAILIHIDTTLSGYNKRSLLSRFNAGEPVRPNALFLEMYGFAYRMWERSAGAVDCAAGPLFDTWGFGFREGTPPTDREVEALREQCGMEKLPRALPLKDGVLDPADLGFPRLNFNAVAQGYSCDLVARYLYGLGVKDMLVDIGEIWCDGHNPSGKPWAVGMDRPVDREGDSVIGDEGLTGVWSSEGRPCGVVTSGNYRKFYVRDGRKYAHTIDPVSGYPVQHNLLSATVVSSEGAGVADAVATWYMVVGLDKARELVQADSTLEAWLVYADENGEMHEWASPGFTLRQ